MAGLLDFNMPGMDTPEGQGLLSAAFSLMQAQKYPGQKGALAGALGDAGKSYLQTTNSSRDQMQRRKYMDAQMEAQQMQLEAARRQQAERERRDAYFRNIGQPQGPAQAMSNGQGPTVANAQRLGQPLQLSPLQVLRDLGPQGLEEYTKIHSTLNPKAEFKAYKPGDVIFKDGDYSNPVFSVPDKPEKETPPELTKLINQMQALPPGSPLRKFYENAIQKATTHQPGVSVTYGAPVAGVDQSGNPIFFQPSKDGSAPSIIPGVAPTPQKMGEKQSNQVAGIDGLSSAIDSYIAALDSWKPADALNVNKRALMGTLYNNMMLQAKEAYNLGVLNGPDYQILQSVIRDPSSIMGMLTSTEEMKRQATTLKREMNKVKSQITKKPVDEGKWGIEKVN